MNTNVLTLERVNFDSCHPKITSTQVHFNSTTSFLTATTLIYAIGAGITAAAGTRLALQLLSFDILNRNHSDDPRQKTRIALIVVTTSFIC